jgi:hypothetical protein
MSFGSRYLGKLSRSIRGHVKLVAITLNSCKAGTAPSWGAFLVRGTKWDDNLRGRDHDEDTDCDLICADDNCATGFGSDDESASHHSERARLGRRNLRSSGNGRWPCRSARDETKCDGAPLSSGDAGAGRRGHSGLARHGGRVGREADFPVKLISLPARCASYFTNLWRTTGLRPDGPAPSVARRTRYAP